jgi:CDP-4-dehydro-6-deoxyglucose reductase
MCAIVFEILQRRARVAAIQPSGRTVTVKHGEKLLTAALAAGLDWPHDCRVGSCGTCRCRLLQGKIKRLTDFSYTLDQAALGAGYILACQTRLASDIEVEVALGSSAETHAGYIATLRALTPDIVELEVLVPRGAFATARAGQYLQVSAPGMAEPRSYSLARAPHATGDRLRFLIRHVPGGAFTDWLFAAPRVGSELTLRGPFGSFGYHDGAGPMLLVAGGSGLAPIYAVLEQAASAGVMRACTLFFGARTQADLYYLDEIAALHARWRGSFELVTVLSAAADDSAWTGPRGFVTDAIPAALVREPGAQAYLCGPPAMVDAGIARLSALGLAPDAVYCDRFLDASTQPGGRAALATHV